MFITFLFYRDWEFGVMKIQAQEKDKYVAPTKGLKFIIFTVPLNITYESGSA
jgi:hypothetical protein